MVSTSYKILAQTGIDTVLQLKVRGAHQKSRFLATQTPLVMTSRHFCSERGSSLLVRFEFVAVAEPTARTRRRGNDVGDPGVVHFFVESGEVVGDSFDGGGSFGDERGQLGQSFLLLAAGSGGKVVEVVEQALDLIGQRIGFPFEWRAGVAERLPRPRVFFGNGVSFFLQFVGGFHDVFGDFRCVFLSRVLLPLVARICERRLNAFDGVAVFVCALGHGVELFDGFMARGAVGSGEGDAIVAFDGDFLRGFFVSSFDLDGVFAGIDEWAARAKTESSGDGLLLLGGGLSGGILAQVPIRAVHAGGAGAVKFANHFAVFVRYGDFDFAFLFLSGSGFVSCFSSGPLFHRIRFLVDISFWSFRRNRVLQVVAEERAIGGILGGEHLLAGAPAALANGPGGGNARREESERRVGDARIHFFDGGEVIENPNGTAVGCEDQIIVARLDFDVVHGNGREIVFQSGPIGAAVPGDPQAKFGSGKEQVGIARMLAKDVNASGGIGDAVANGFPGFAVIGGRENVNVVIVGAVSVEGGEGGAFGCFGSHNAAYIGSFGHAGGLRYNVLPGFSAVARDLQVAVVGADPEHVGGERRFAQSGDRRIFLNAVVARQSILVGYFAADGEFVAVHAGGQVAAEARPGISAIGGFEEIVAAVIDGGVFMRGDGHR